MAAARRRFASSAPIDLAPHRLFVDLTTIARRDARTGIQRVVRSTMAHMQAHPQGWLIEPARYTDNAFRLTNWPNTDGGAGRLMDLRPGDVFLGLDLSLDAIRRTLRDLLARKRAGVRFWFVVYDLLPIQSPQHFSAKVAVRFRWWLLCVAQLADGFLCISDHTAQDLREMLSARFGLGSEIDIRVVPMGFDILPNAARSFPRAVTPPTIAAQNVILAVGTLEPRKGYTLLLDAFEIIWTAGADLALVIVGADGWKTAALQARIRAHAERGRRLHWLPELDDVELAGLYDHARMLVAASHGEGFGLPILEAVAHACPVLARDIPAFRAHAGFGLRYFARDANAVDLADAILGMMRDGDTRRAADPALRLPSWRETSDTVLTLLARSR